MTFTCPARCGRRPSLSLIHILILAARGYGLWALLATDVVTLALAVVAFYLWRPVWRPRLLWAADTMRYYLRFGSRAMAESALSEALDNLDDLWTGSYLGAHALGLYSLSLIHIYPRPDMVTQSTSVGIAQGRKRKAMLG